MAALEARRTGNFEAIIPVKNPEVSDFDAIDSAETATWRGRMSIGESSKDDEGRQVHRAAGGRPHRHSFQGVL